MQSNASVNPTVFQSFDKTLDTGVSSELLMAPVSSLKAPIYTGASSSLVFIDTNVPDSQSLVQGIKPGTEVYFLESNKNAIAQITETLLGRQGISSLQIISHGNVGSLDFASSSLNINNIRTYTNELQTWGKALTADADVLLYGCNVAAGEVGANFVTLLSQLTGADVAASNDLTGSSNKGGNWTLENITGNIEASSALSTEVMRAYKSVLANAGDVIINEFSQGSTGAKEWLEILVVTDNLDLRNHKLVDTAGTNRLDITLSGSGFSSLKAGTLIVLYNGGDVDSTITPDLNYDPVNGDYVLQVSSLNNSDAFAITRTNGWSNATEAFSNSSTTDTPRLLNSSGAEIYRLPKATPAGFSVLSASPGKATAFIGNSALGATQPANWSDDYYSAAGNPGLANGGINTAWINLLRGNVSPAFNNSTNLTLPSINEDIPLTINKGVFVSDLIKGQVTDINNNIQGIAVTDVTGGGNWQYSVNGGDTWSGLGQLSEASATVLTGLVSLYNGGANTTPNNQGWLQYGASPPISNLGTAVGGTQTANNGATNLVSTESGSAGYSNYNGGLPIILNPALPILDRNQGFTLSFEVKINDEKHSDNTRAGFNVILVTSDKTRAIELGFWKDSIFAQNSTFTASTESVARNTTALTRYDLKVQGDTYQLFAAGETKAILTGLLRDYTGFDHTTAGPFSTALPYDPYERENFIFLGDNTSRASADISLARVELMTNTKIRFAPSANYNGDATIKFRAWDGTNGAATGSSGVNSTASSAFSGTSKIANLTVNSILDWQIVGVEDFTGDGKQDIVQRDENGNYRLWRLLNNAGETAALPTITSQWQIAGIADFNRDNAKDIFWYNPTTGQNRIWQMSNTGASEINILSVTPGNGLKIEHVGDFDGDGDADILWRDASGIVTLWEMNNTNVVKGVGLPGTSDINIKIEKIVDFDRDGDLDILWRDYATGYITMLEMNKLQWVRGINLPGFVNPNIKLEAVVNFDGDGDLDIIWRDYSSGGLTLWEMNGLECNKGIGMRGIEDADAKLEVIADFDNDGKLDILWNDTKNGWHTVWKMDGSNVVQGIGLPGVGDTAFKMRTVGDFNGDGKIDIVFHDQNTSITKLWFMDGTNYSSQILLPG